MQPERAVKREIEDFNRVNGCQLRPLRDFPLLMRMYCRGACNKGNVCVTILIVIIGLAAIGYVAIGKDLIPSEKYGVLGLSDDASVGVSALFFIGKLILYVLEHM